MQKFKYDSYVQEIAKTKLLDKSKLAKYCMILQGKLFT
jgi:hypothetical protein